MLSLKMKTEPNQALQTMTIINEIVWDDPK